MRDIWEKQQFSILAQAILEGMDNNYYYYYNNLSHTPNILSLFPEYLLSALLLKEKPVHGPLFLHLLVRALDWHKALSSKKSWRISSGYNLVGLTGPG